MGLHGMDQHKMFLALVPAAQCQCISLLQKHALALPQLALFSATTNGSITMSWTRRIFQSSGRIIAHLLSTHRLITCRRGSLRADSTSSLKEAVRWTNRIQNDDSSEDCHGRSVHSNGHSIFARHRGRRKDIWETHLCSKFAVPRQSRVTLVEQHGTTSCGNKSASTATS